MHIFLLSTSELLHNFYAVVWSLSFHVSCGFNLVRLLVVRSQMVSLEFFIDIILPNLIFVVPSIMLYSSELSPR